MTSRKIGIDNLRQAQQWTTDGMWNEIMAYQTGQVALREACFAERRRMVGEK
jgi:hypothetical protein